MKVEVELEELLALKKDVLSLQETNQQLEEKIKSLNEPVLKKQACDLARKMFGDVMSRVFNDLEFKDITDLDDIGFQELENYLGSKWWHSDRLNIQLGATITNNFKGAFLKMGIKTMERG